MERGPTVLFGAIVAVGLGPAMWLGAQFGQVAVTPLTPSAPSIVVDTPAGKAAGGAGAAPDALTADTGNDTGPSFVPLPAATSVRPSASRVATAVTKSPSATVPPPAASSAPASSAGPSTEATTTPSAEPSDVATEVPTSPITLPPTDPQGTAVADASPPVV